MKFLTPILLISIFFVIEVQNANILAILPLVHKSHFVMYKKLLEELSKKGHNVDVIGGIPPKNSDKSIQSPNYIEITNLTVPEIPKFTIKQLREFTVNYALKFMLNLDAPTTCEKVFNAESIKNLKNSTKKYDVLIIEIFIYECFFGFAHIFKVPVISLISSSDLPWGGYRIGNPDNPAYIPVYFQGLKPDKSLYDKFWNTASYIQIKITYWWYIQEQNRLSKNFFGKDTPDLDDIISNSSLLLTNSHFSLNMARPAVPNFVEVGGLHITTPKPLEKTIANFIANDKFIYFSFGSIANSDSFEPEILKIILEVFSELPFKILWKANETELRNFSEIPANILVQLWMPQLDILCHPNIVLFITHSGLMGTQEAVYCGVPMLCFPLFADQYQNCQNMIDRNVAKTLEIETLTKTKLRDTIRELTSNLSFAKNAKNLSQQFKDRPMTPLETAIFWIEYVIRYGDGALQLKSVSRSLNWYQYHLLDVFCIFLLIFVFLVSVFYVVSKSLLRYLKRKIGVEKKKKD